VEGDIYSWGPRVGSIAGIPIRIHWTLLALWAYRLNERLQYGGDGSVAGTWGVMVVLSFGTILLHEIGHCIAARSVGGSASEILLWPLGGLASCSAPNLWRSQLIVAAGGPLVTAAIFGVAKVSFALGHAWAPAAMANVYVRAARSILVDWQLVLLVFNSIPLYPLDGGRMFHALLWGFYRRKGGHVPGAYGRATLVTVWVSRAAVVAGIIYVVWQRQPLYNILLFLWAWSGTEALRRRLAEGAEEDYSFGYDFSRGYVSLEGRPRRGRRRRSLTGLFRRRSEQALRPRDALDARKERERVDELLAKISREGTGALSVEERKFLEDVGRRWSR
jgi:Zn-dependent protease